MMHDLSFNLYLIRHGQSEVNARPDEMGQLATTPLTDLGKSQAQLLGIYLYDHGMTFDKVYSSTYTRAFDTASIAMRQVVGDKLLDISPHHELREYSSGDWLACSRKETMTPEIKQKMNILNQTFLPPNGESLNQVERRVSKWFEETVLYNPTIKGLYDKKQAPLDIICFSHGMTIKTFLHYVMGFDKGLTWRISIDNTSITKLHFNENAWAIDYVNNTPHILGS